MSLNDDQTEESNHAFYEALKHVLSAKSLAIFQSSGQKASSCFWSSKNRCILFNFIWTNPGCWRVGSTKYDSQSYPVSQFNYCGIAMVKRANGQWDVDDRWSRVSRSLYCMNDPESTLRPVLSTLPSYLTITGFFYVVLLWFWQINRLNSSEGFAPGWCANKKPRRSIRTAGFFKWWA